MNQTLFDLAHALNERHEGYDGSGAVPLDLMVAIRDATGLDDSGAIAVARIVLLAMTTQRAVSRLSGGAGVANPSDDFDDCLAPD